MNVTASNAQLFTLFDRDRIRISFHLQGYRVTFPDSLVCVMLSHAHWTMQTMDKGTYCKAATRPDLPTTLCFLELELLMVQRRLYHQAVGCA